MFMLTHRWSLGEAESSDGKTVELDVDQVARRVTTLTANRNIGATGLLDWNAENRHTQTVQTKKAVATVAARQLLAVAALCSALLGVDVGFACVG